MCIGAVFHKLSDARSLRYPVLARLSPLSPCGRGLGRGVPYKAISKIKNGADGFRQTPADPPTPSLLKNYFPIFFLTAAITASLDVAFTLSNIPSFS